MRISGIVYKGYCGKMVMNGKSGMWKYLMILVF